jgi:hypothetical protein
MIEDKDIPKVFALVRDDDEQGQIVGYGMVLPDGSTYSVSWPARLGAAFYSASSAQETAELRGADVLWVGERP